MNKVPQIGRRRIGSVVIIDLKGEIVGPWALHARENMKALIKRSKTEQILINLKDVTTIDSLGVKAIIENFPRKAQKSGIVSGRISVMEMFSLLADMQGITVFKNEDDVIACYAQDFVTDNDFVPVMEEQRQYSRLKTALPLEFWYATPEGERITFAAIVTDLSEGGLFAEYLDVESLQDFTRCFQVHELRELHLKVKLPDEQHIFVTGAVTRTVIASEQVGLGMQFVDLSAADRKKIITFLED